MSKKLNIFFILTLFSSVIILSKTGYADTSNEAFSIKTYKKSAAKNNYKQSTQTYKKSTRSAALGPKVRAHKVTPVAKEKLPVIRQTPAEALQGSIQKGALDFSKKFVGMFQVGGANKTTQVSKNVPLPPRRPGSKHPLSSAVKETSADALNAAQLNQLTPAAAPSVAKAIIPKMASNAKMVRFMYEEGKHVLDVNSAKKMKALSILLKQKPSTTIQVKAYSKPDMERLSGGRRIAFARALSVRNYLMQRGIQKNRIYVQVPDYDSADGLHDLVEIHLVN